MIDFLSNCSHSFLVIDQLIDLLAVSKESGLSNILTYLSYVLCFYSILSNFYKHMLNPD